ncbi:hypothetical protein PHYBOEH_011606 [Phytophthora boehmeriae]|uniref:Uncharacterized protein n=1 Tax=Phytophthora boehmeriae TaxID=109152 RepID=A0A8T1X627_9STRA|nr:hypothetical protein PHYBOEH_011606 [Phytophthora boehmeriae]
MELFTPSATINYNFVAGVYAFFTALCALLLALHFYSPQVEGFYIVLVPFVPCFLWSLVVRHRWLQQKTDAPDQDADESKKDKLCVYSTEQHLQHPLEALLPRCLLWLQNTLKECAQFASML